MTQHDEARGNSPANLFSMTEYEDDNLIATIKYSLSYQYLQRKGQEPNFHFFLLLQFIKTTCPIHQKLNFESLQIIANPRLTDFGKEKYPFTYPNLAKLHQNNKI